MDVDDASSLVQVSDSVNRTAPTMAIPFNQHSPSNHKRCCQSNKYGSMISIMGIGDPALVESSIHDSDIDNNNRLIFDKTAKVVNDCKGP